MKRVLTARLIIATTVAAGAAAPATATAAVSVYPSPGVISASPQTQISFRGLPLAQLGGIRVRGSRTGSHAGRLRAHSDGKGASWLPRKRFRPGERVSVRTSLSIRGARRGDFSFRIARLVRRVTKQQKVREVKLAGLRHFRSLTNIAPPRMSVVKGAGAKIPGYVFSTPKSKKDIGQAGPMIVDNHGDLVWFKPVPGVRAATDFRAQTYRGKPVLTYWEGTSRQGIGYGELVILDDSYREIKRIRRVNGYRPDLHEFLITPNDTALMITYPAVRADLRRVGGKRRAMAVDGVIQEVDIATGLVVWEWHSLGKIGFKEGYKPAPRSPNLPHDYLHANSVELDTDGNILMSARNTWAVYKINRATGRIMWRLGGKRSTFKLGRGVKFAWQHDARRRADGALTVFDNASSPPVRKYSRVLAIHLDERRKTAKLLWAGHHPRKMLAATQGSMQPLPGGGSFASWGSQRAFNDFDSSGRVSWSAYLPPGFESYRGFRYGWVGRPVSKPAGVPVKRSGGQIDVYASWNGATEVRTWEVLAGSSPTALAPLASGNRAGFETRIRVADNAPYVAVRARDKEGAVLGESAASRVR